MNLNCFNRQDAKRAKTSQIKNDWNHRDTDAKENKNQCLCFRAFVLYRLSLFSAPLCLCG
jgi:hypothetical protein